MMLATVVITKYRILLFLTLLFILDTVTSVALDRQVQAVPLHRYLVEYTSAQPSVGPNFYHYYTTCSAAADLEPTAIGRFESNIGYVLPEKPDGIETVKLYMLRRRVQPYDYFLTTNEAEAARARTPSDGYYLVEGCNGYISPKQLSGTVALFRLAYKGTHFYTTNAPERARVISQGWQPEGIAGYVWTQPKVKVPLPTPIWIPLVVLAALAVGYGVYLLLPAKEKDNKVIVGTVGGFQSSSDGGGGQARPQQVWSFRVDRFDAEGNSLDPIPVQLKARGFDGFVRDGDKVRIAVGSWKPGKILSPSRFYNETTRSEVRVKSCFIATAAFGDPNDRYVQLLANFRDVQLQNTRLGQRFVTIYYHVSPPLARIIAKNEWARLGTRWLLKCFVRAACPNVRTTPNGDIDTYGK
jgi:hypothetical protein